MLHKNDLFRAQLVRKSQMVAPSLFTVTVTHKSTQICCVQRVACSSVVFFFLISNSVSVIKNYLVANCNSNKDLYDSFKSYYNNNNNNVAH